MSHGPRVMAAANSGHPSIILHAIYTCVRACVRAWRMSEFGAARTDPGRRRIARNLPIICCTNRMFYRLISLSSRPIQVILYGVLTRNREILYRFVRKFILKKNTTTYYILICTTNLFLKEKYCRNKRRRNKAESSKRGRSRSTVHGTRGREGM